MSPAITPVLLHLSVNGADHPVHVDPDTPLLSVLRDTLQLKGTRFGCGEERCGACTVLVDGQPQHTCRLPVAHCTGHAITTIEGLGSAAAPGPMQQRFLAAQAAQCGYCTNGLIVALTGLLQRRPLPSRGELLHYLDERHLCRCGAHPRILKVIDQALADAAQVEGCAR